MMKFEDIQAGCKKMVTTARISTMLVCIHGKKGEDLFGEILNCYMEKPVPFSSLGDLILKMDEMCNWIGTPHPTTEPRFINKQMEKQYNKRMEGKNNIPMRAKIQLMESSLLITKAVKARETLMVKIEYRQFSSLQGRVLGKMTAGKYIGFRSALELMRMIREISILES